MQRTFPVASSVASSGSRSSLAGLSRFGPTQMARLLQLILLVDALWPICWRRDSSRCRRRRFAAGNLPATLREQEHNVKKADVAHGRPQSLCKAGGSQGLCCAAFQVLPASGQCSWASGRKHGVASQLLTSLIPTQGKAPCPCPLPRSPAPPDTAGCQKTQLSKELVPLQASPGPRRVAAQKAGCRPHLRFQLFHLCLLAWLLHGAHPVLVEVDDEELGRDASEEVLQCQGLQVSL